MKRSACLLITLLLVYYSQTKANTLIAESSFIPQDSITVLTSPDLLNLTNDWAYEYNKLVSYPKIRVTGVSDSKIVANRLAKGNIGFVSEKYCSGFDHQSVSKIVVGRDVIVPVINSKNPCLDEINRKGISPASLALFLGNNNLRTWGTLINGSQNSSADFYIIKDKAITGGISEFLKKDVSAVDSREFANARDMISAIIQNPYSLGFCRITDIIYQWDQLVTDNIRLLPIDRNGNGVLDYNEKIYDDINIFSRGVWIGKYPAALISNIYSVSSHEPKKDAELAFIKWVLNDGQKFLYSNGYSNLLTSERQSAADKLYNAQIPSGQTPGKKSFPETLLILIGILVTAGIIIDLTLRYLRNKRRSGINAGSSLRPALNENSLLIPGGIYFDKTHTWAFLEQDGMVKMGVDDFLQHLTGTITRVKMKNPGDIIKKGDLILSVIQNGKQLNLYSPVSGVIRKQNKLLDTSASLINSSPYNAGWVYLIEPSNWSRENQLLFMAEKHLHFIKNEFARLKDFLAESLKEDADKYAQVILQDGGELRDGILSSLGPEIWEDFQANFIDPSRQLWFYEMF